MSDLVPYGSWPSPIAPADLATAGLRLGPPSADGDRLHWVEGRPTEGGRSVLVRRHPDGTITDLGPPDLSVRTLVHEYGGRCSCAAPGGMVVSTFADQRLWLLPDDGGDPVALTPEPPAPRSVRFADPVASPDGTSVYAVRETHGGDEVVNDIVRVPLDGGDQVAVVGGHDFFSTPRLSPDGATLAWVSWDHPRMPWDGTDLWTAPVAADGSVGEATHVAGGRVENVQQPAFDADGLLHFVSDRSGWWNVHRVEAGIVVPLHDDEVDAGYPPWVFGASTYALLPDGRIVTVAYDGGLVRLLVIEADGRVRDVDVPFVSMLGPVALPDGRVALVAAGPATPRSIVIVDIGGDTAGVEVVRRSAEVDPDPADVSEPESLGFPTGDGEVAHALFYAPRRSGVVGPDGERPPLLVLSHGGPTGATEAGYDPGIQFWTTRGVAVVDVNYRGSTGYGRAYRNALDGRWGLADVDDCVAAARHLAERGDVDGDRLLITGGSAGGYTTLCALAFRDGVFAAGSSRYGVGDLATLARDTHKFESRYLDGLIGPWPEAEAVYAERSPLHHVDRLRTPMILLQGSEDAIVPPAQAEAMVAALARAGVPHAYLLFEGEQHGFRRAENIARAAEAEYAFFCAVLGIEPSGDPEPVEIRGGPA